MKQVCMIAFAAPLAMAASSADAQNQPVVVDKASCVQAVEDAKTARNEGDVSQAVKVEVDDLLRIAEHLCGEANFVYAERLLAIARGMVAGE